ncbi:hypothetical protein GCM10023259_012490 [Thermocatellispora tengchongensis]
MADHLQRAGHDVQGGRLAADVFRGALLRVLRAVAGLYDQGPALGDLGEGSTQGPYVRRPYQRGTRGRHLPDALDLRDIAPLRLLRRRTQPDAGHGVVHGSPLLEGTCDIAGGLALV